MADPSNRAKERLAAGEISIGCGVRAFGSAQVAAALAAASFDWLFIDLEHGTLSIDQCAEVPVGALGLGIAPLVRVPGGDYRLATRALEGGALGIVMPHVDTATDARELVECVKMAPLGRRNPAGPPVQVGYAALPRARLAEAINAAALAVVMLETPRAIANAAEIAEVEGIDVLMIGANDLSTEMGIAGKLDDPPMVAAFETVVSACRAAGKWPGFGGVQDQVLLARYVGMGMRFVLAGNDLGFLISAARARANLLREMPLLPREA